MYMKVTQKQCKCLLALVKAVRKKEAGLTFKDTPEYKVQNDLFANDLEAVASTLMQALKDKRI